MSRRPGGLVGEMGGEGILGAAGGQHLIPQKVPHNAKKVLNMCKKYPVTQRWWLASKWQKS